MITREQPMPNSVGDFLVFTRRIDPRNQARIVLGLAPRLTLTNGTDGASLVRLTTPAYLSLPIDQQVIQSEEDREVLTRRGMDLFHAFGNYYEYPDTRHGLLVKACEARNGIKIPKFSASANLPKDVITPEDLRTIGFDRVIVARYRMFLEAEVERGAQTDYCYNPEFHLYWRGIDIFADLVAGGQIDDDKAGVVLNELLTELSREDVQKRRVYEYMRRHQMQGMIDAMRRYGDFDANIRHDINTTRVLETDTSWPGLLQRSR